MSSTCSMLFCEIVLRSNEFSARHERRYSSTFSRSFFPLSLSAFYPAHPCGTANVSQGLPGTRTVTKWNGRKNEWKTIKEGSGERGDSWRERRRIRGDGERRKRGEAEEKTEGRPPSGLIKSITSSLDLARDSPPPSPPPPHSRSFSFTPNSHNCSFFPLRRSSSYDGSQPSRPLLAGFFAVSSTAVVYLRLF